MRYIKALLLVVIFFLAIVFFFQNQEILNKDAVLKINLFFLKPWSSIPLPLYFLLLLGFLFGALLTLFLLVWDKFCNSARLMRATWRVRSLEKEVLQLQSTVNNYKKKEALPPARHEVAVEARPAPAEAQAPKVEEKPAEAPKAEEKPAEAEQEKK